MAALGEQPRHVPAEKAACTGNEDWFHGDDLAPSRAEALRRLTACPTTRRPLRFTASIRRAQVLSPSRKSPEPESEMCCDNRCRSDKTRGESPCPWHSLHPSFRRASGLPEGIRHPYAG